MAAEVQTAAEATAPLWVYGVAGGMLAEVLRWWRLREILYKGVPEYARDWKYWVATLVMAGVGGFLVVLHGAQMTPILAANIGASAPLILSAMVDQAPGVAVVEQESSDGN